MTLSLWLCAVMSCACIVVGTRSNIQLINNGYQGLVVEVKPFCDADTPQGDMYGVLQGLIHQLTEASSALFVATRYRAYIRDATVVLPMDYGDIPGIGITTQTSTTPLPGNIVVDHAHPAHQHRPYVLQPGRCSEPAQYVHLTHQYLANSTLADMYGDVGKTFVHELGHLLWGLFDEYTEVSSREAPANITHSGTLTCPKNLKGTLVNKNTGESCNSEVAEECAFLANHDQMFANGATLMAYHYAYQVQQFCDSTSSAEHLRHNPLASNRHNRLCTSASGLSPSNWDIMLQHEDFTDNHNSPTYPTTVTAPSIAFVRSNRHTIILVLDVSLSMNEANKLDAVRVATSLFIRNALTGCHLIGIVAFSTTASVAQPITSIDSQDDIEAIIRAIPQDAFGSTCIGCGIFTAIDMLEELSLSTTDTLVILTDGTESIHPFISRTVPHIMARQITVDTILYDIVDTSHPLYDLSVATGGQVVHAQSGDVHHLTQSMVSLIHKRTCLTNTHSSMLYAESTELRNNGEAFHNFPVDPTSNDMVQIYISANSSIESEFSVLVATPRAIIYRLTDFHIETASSVSLSASLERQVGEWFISIDSDRDFPISYDVIVTATGRVTSCSQQPITITPVLTSQVDLDGMTSFPRFVIGCEVKRGSAGLPGVLVTAIVTHMDAKYYYTLRDNGDGDVDMMSGDGFYSAAFRHFVGSGFYYVTYRVTGSVGGSVPLDAGASHVIDLPALSGLNLDSTDDPDTSSFTRYHVGSFFEVINQPDNTTSIDLYTPGKVTDLKVIYDKETSTAQLVFTPAGDDYDFGSATEYDIRVSTTSAEDLYTNFSASQSAVELGHVDSDVITNITSNNDEQPIYLNITLSEAEYGTEFYYALVALDGSGNRGDVSNLAIFTSSLIYPAPITSTPSSPPTDTPPTDPPSTANYGASTRGGDTSISASAIALLVTLAVLMVIAVIILVIWLKLREKKRHAYLQTSTTRLPAGTIYDTENGFFRNPCVNSVSSTRTFIHAYAGDLYLGDSVHM